MRVRRLPLAVVAALLLLGCSPDQLTPGAGSPSIHPTDHEMATPTPGSDATEAPTNSPEVPGGDPYDY